MFKIYFKNGHKNGQWIPVGNYIFKYILNTFKFETILSFEKILLDYIMRDLWFISYIKPEIWSRICYSVLKNL